LKEIKLLGIVFLSRNEYDWLKYREKQAELLSDTMDKLRAELHDLAVENASLKRKNKELENWVKQYQEALEEKDEELRALFKSKARK
jgi:uncharacterized protein YlxW (UPF0749 family)